MKRELSSGIGVASFEDGLQGGDDAVEARLDLAEVGGQAKVAAGVGLGDEDPVGAGLLAVHAEELGRGLEVGARETGVWMRAVLLWRPPAVAVGEAVAHTRQVVLDPLSGGGGAIRIEREELA